MGKKVPSNSSNLISLVILGLNHLHATRRPLNPSSSLHQWIDSHPFKQYYYRIEYGTSSLTRRSSRSPTNSQRGSKITVLLFTHFQKIRWSRCGGISSDWKRLEVFQRFSVLNCASEMYSSVCSLGLYRQLHTVTGINGKIMKKQTILGEKKNQIFCIKKFHLRIHRIC